MRNKYIFYGLLFLLVSCGSDDSDDNNPNLPVADFYYEPEIIEAGETIRFYDNSQGNPTSWNWKFDGAEATTSSVNQNPITRYEDSGVFTVVMTATNEFGSSTVSKDIGIDVPAITVDIEVQGNPELLTGEEICFKTNITGEYSYFIWDGDGDNNNGFFGEEICFDYWEPGDYYISLSVINSEETKQYDQVINFSIARRDDTKELVDIHGNTYKVVQIAGRSWTAENLKVTLYSNGAPIVDGSTIGPDGTTEGAYYTYEGHPEAVDIFGLYYNWRAVIDENGLCPDGWHVPTLEDRTDLFNYLYYKTGHYPNFGDDLKAVDENFWQHEDTNPTDAIGFAALPAGATYPDADIYSEAAFWFNHANEDTTTASFFNLLNFASEIRYDYSGSPQFGFSCRCVKDD